MKLIKDGRMYHLEGCQFPFEDQAVCNCPHIEVRDLEEEARQQEERNEMTDRAVKELEEREFATKKEVSELKEDIKKAMGILSAIIKYNIIK